MLRSVKCQVQTFCGLRFATFMGGKRKSTDGSSKPAKSVRKDSFESGAILEAYPHIAKICEWYLSLIIQFPWCHFRLLMACVW